MKSLEWVLYSCYHLLSRSIYLRKKFRPKNELQHIIVFPLQIWIWNTYTSIYCFSLLQTFHSERLKLGIRCRVSCKIVNLQRVWTFLHQQQVSYLRIVPSSYIVIFCLVKVGQGLNFITYVCMTWLSLSHLVIR